MANLNKYIYEGPVIEFEKCIANKWRGETTASSETKAISNLKYQFKRQFNKLPSAKIDLPGKLRMTIGG